jgi:hypothetical protein
MPRVASGVMQIGAEIRDAGARQLRIMSDLSGELAWSAFIDAVAHHKRRQPYVLLSDRAE